MNLELLKRITIEPGKCGGRPCIRGMRMRVTCLMRRFIADENFKGAVVRGLLRRRPALDLVRVQDIDLSGINDPDLLAWAAREHRVILTHDVTTLRL